MKKITLIIGLLLILMLTSCDSDEGKIYTSRDPDECKTMLFTCAPGREPFFNDKGCGCELIEDMDDLDLNPNRKNAPIIPPKTGNDWGENNTDPSLRNMEDDENANNRADEDPLERNLDTQQDRRLENNPPL